MNTSSVQRLFMRRTKTVLPNASDLLAPEVEKEENVTKLLNDKRKKAKCYHVRSSHLLRNLLVNEIVRG